MTIHPYDDLEAFALGALDEDTSRTVLAHADNCPSCAAVLGQAMRTVDAIEPTATIPLAVGTHVTADVPLRPTQWERAAKLWRTLAVMGAAAACVAILWAINVARTPKAVTSGGLTVPIALLVHSHFLHHALHGPVGSAKVIQALDGSWVYLVADGLPPNATYTLVELTGDKGSLVGSGTTATSGEIAAYWRQAARHIDRFVLTVSGTQPLERSSTLRWP